MQVLGGPQNRPQRWGLPSPCWCDTQSSGQERPSVGLSGSHRSAGGGPPCARAGPGHGPPHRRTKLCGWAPEPTTSHTGSGMSGMHGTHTSNAEKKGRNQSGQYASPGELRQRAWDLKKKGRGMAAGGELQQRRQPAHHPGQGWAAGVPSPRRSRNHSQQKRLVPPPPSLCFFVPLKLNSLGLMEPPLQVFGSDFGGAGLEPGKQWCPARGISQRPSGRPA